MFSIQYFIPTDKDHLLDRNERIGSAIATVSDILERFNKTSGSNLYIASFISSVHVVKADTT